jgi:single-strand DNA-binding protein
MNKVFISGNLGSQPEAKQTKSGMAVTNLSVATNERTKKADGEWTDHTEWHQVTVFGGQATNCANWLTTGSKVLVEGKLRTRKWTDANGNERKTTEIVADRVEFMSKPVKLNNGRPPAPSSQWPDDEIPF